MAFKLQLFTCFAKPWVEASMKRSGNKKCLGDERKKNSFAQICGVLKLLKGRWPGWFGMIFVANLEVIDPLHNMLESI